MVERPESPDEDFLDGIFGLFLTAQKSVGKRIKQWRIPLHDVSKSFSIALQRLLHCHEITCVVVDQGPSLRLIYTPLGTDKLQRPIP